MSPQIRRTARGGRIDRSAPLAFTFDGVRYEGYRGDTLASALLANGVRVVGRSFKYHRRRGVFGAGAEEPNALVRVGVGARAEPNLKATRVELRDGLVAESQNRWPSLGFDVGGLGNIASKLLPAGFYYKTFMWPGSWWMFYERLIRKAAGLGRAPVEPDPDRYDRRYAFCDVLVAGAGPAGLMAALTAARSGARVILADDAPVLGGSLLASTATIEGADPAEFVSRIGEELASRPNVRVLSRTTAFGYYDDNMVVAVERRADHLPEPPAHCARQRVWWIRAKEVVLATGAIERPVPFEDNDLPGVMLASAARTWAFRYGVRPGDRAVVFTNNDSAYEAIEPVLDTGTDIVAVVDARADGPGSDALAVVRRFGIELVSASVVMRAIGRTGVDGVEVRPLSPDGASVGDDSRRIPCDLVCVSGGWNPTVHLFSQSRGRLRFDAERAAFVPGESAQRERSAGASRGLLRLSECLADGIAAGADAVRAAGFEAGPVPSCPAVREWTDEAPVRPLWAVPLPSWRHGKRFVDFQNDVTVADIELAAREGYTSVEHLKRYTTLGMGTDQGRTSNVNGLAVLAATLGADIPAVGTTTFRPPYSPVALGAIAGREVGADQAPVRRTPMHDSMLAGMLPSRVRAFDNGAELCAATPTMAHYLRLAGYHTTLSGKQHFVGPDMLHGFHERLVPELYPTDFLWAPSWDEVRMDSNNDSTGVTRAGVCVRTMQMDHDEAVLFRAVSRLHDFAREPDRRPFLLVASFTHPHEPYFARREHWDRYRHEEVPMPATPLLPEPERDLHSQRMLLHHGLLDGDITGDHVRTARHGYLANCTYLDEMVGRLLDTLEATGLARTTAVVVTADHGDMLGERGMWFKKHFFDHAARVPLVIHAPWRFAPVRRPENVSLVDLLPTLCDLARVDLANEAPRPPDGASLIPLCDGPAVVGDAPVFAEITSEGVPSPMFMVRHGRFKLMTGGGAPDLLFDLGADPEERTDLAADPTHRASLAALRRLAEETWDAAALETAVRVSQRERRLVQAAHGGAGVPAWDALESDPVWASCLRTPDGYNDWAWRGIEPSPLDP